MSTQVMQPSQTLQRVKAEKKILLAKIMVLTDFSEESDSALKYAMAVARRYDARVYLTHILSPDAYALAEPSVAELRYQKMREAAEQSFREILISGKLRGVPHETLLYEGSFWPTVERLIQKHEIDLIVTGTHGRGQLKKFFFGSVAEEVFRQADCAVLTVGPANWKETPQELNLENIVFATDFGPGAARAAQYAFSRAREHGARLTVLHVIEEAAAYTQQTEAKLHEVNIAQLKKYMPPESENWCKVVNFRVTFGPAVEEILNDAGKTHADLIIMGAKTRRNLAGHVPTIAYNVAAKAQCPVLTVRG
jgi:nucleotide-binding universal stress UspA family protein